VIAKLIQINCQTFLLDFIVLNMDRSAGFVKVLRARRLPGVPKKAKPPG